MAKYNGLTEHTTKNLLLDAGVLFVNFDVNTDTYASAKETKLLGATSGR